MSYILEALKKAQAERQIGETPTIHAPTISPASDDRRSAGNRKPLLVGVGLLGGAVVVMGAMLLRQQSPAPGASAPTAGTSPAVSRASNAGQPMSAAPVATAGQPDAAATVAPPSDLAASPASAGAARPLDAQPSAGLPPVGQPPAAATQPSAAGQPPVAAAQPNTAVQSTVAAQRSAAAQPSADAARSSAGPQRSGIAAQGAADSPSVSPGATSVAAGPRLVAAPTQERATDGADVGATSRKRRKEDEEGARVAKAASAIAAPAATAATAAAEEHIQTVRELPEPIQRAIPQITLGGYMYSKNPADRLILIDKTLRKEGDEVAPGLQLEKLLPKAAVFSFRGYRYKVPL